MSTPRDYNQPPWPQRPNQGPYPGQNPAPRPGARPGWDPNAATQFGPPPTPAQPQWNQPPPRQWAQPSPPPASAPPPASTPKKSKSNKTPLLIAGAIVAVVVVVAIVAVVLMSGAGGSKDVSKIAVADVQTEIPKVLVDRTSGYESGDIKDVKCNDGQDPTGSKGDSFTCTATVRGKQRKLTVTFQDDKGTYVVGLPQLEGGR